MLVTLDLLKKMPSGERACFPALEWFADEFPDGAEIASAWAASPLRRWQIWFACNWLTGQALSDLDNKFIKQGERYNAKHYRDLCSSDVCNTYAETVYSHAHWAADASSTRGMTYLDALDKQAEWCWQAIQDALEKEDK